MISILLLSNKVITQFPDIKIGLDSDHILKLYSISKMIC
jgi:hypothetical protein